MTRKDLVLIFILSLVIISLAGFLQKSAGYMDSEYYAVTGKSLMAGHGFMQNFLWNYLDDPATLPHPSNTYWMPLATIFSTISFWFQSGTQKTTIWIVQILFSSLIPVITAWLAYSYTSRRSDGWMAGLLGLFSGFYLLYYAVPETFTPEMVFGTLLIILLARQLKPSDRKIRYWTWLGIGVICGLLHMTRAEGFIWMIITLGCLIFFGFRSHKMGNALTGVVMVVLGYALISGTWYGRNLVLWGQLFPPGSNRTLWLNDYNQMFLFSPEPLTFRNWLSQGLGIITKVRLDALWMNIKSAIAVQGGILLVPFIIAGWWAKRRENGLILAFLYYTTIFVIMTLVFPLAGARGGFIHAAAGVQLFLWAVVPVGLDRFLLWGERKRNWQIDQARKVFQIGIVGIMVLLTSVIYFQRVISTTNGTSNWLIEENKYHQVHNQLKQLDDYSDGVVVMIKNPPGWNLVTGKPAVVIPDGGLEVVKAAAAKFEAKILIIDKDYPQGLKLFYQGLQDDPKIQPIFTLGDIKVYRLILEP